MKAIQTILLAIILIGFTKPVEAQMVADPTTWTYSVRKLSTNEYKLVFHVSLKEGWHIFSQKPGDEFLIPPSFTFAKNKNVQLIGKIEELGTLKSEKMEGIDNPINYYEHAADFVQKVRVTGKGKVVGEQEYQVCNDRMCLPPKKKSFEFVIKD